MTAQPFGTALGSGWSGGFGRLGTADATLLGLGLNYNLDAQTSLYARYEGLSFMAAGATAAQNQNIWAGGIPFLLQRLSGIRKDRFFMAIIPGCSSPQRARHTPSHAM